LRLINNLVISDHLGFQVKVRKRSRNPTWPQIIIPSKYSLSILYNVTCLRKVIVLINPELGLIVSNEG